jgi:circadian clock protein KaiC
MDEKASTGIRGLDDILKGGLARGRMYLLEGEPGTGKTTVALQFLLTAAQAGETSLYLTLSETEAELRAAAASHGWSIGKEITVHELITPDSLFDPDQQQSLLYASDLELGEATGEIFDIIDRLKPLHVVIDSLSEIRLLAQSQLRYRRQILAIKHRLARRDTTVVMLDDLTSEAGDRTMHSIAHAVIRLEELAPTYGAERRRVRVLKYRAQSYRGGYHDFTISTGGVKVFPRLVAAEHHTGVERRQISSGVEELDVLLGGGVESGSSVLILGPAGTGKSLIAVTFAMATVKRGEKAILYVFDEEQGLLLTRMKGLGIDLTSGGIAVEQIDAAELSPGEFAHRVREAVETKQLTTVVIDSLNGYQAAMPDEKSLILHIHELLQFLNRRGVTTFMTVAQHGLVGETEAPIDATYLADTVILLRYFEAQGQVRRAVSIIKKRTGAHEPTIREYSIGTGGITLGAPLEAFQGILGGFPTYIGDTVRLMKRSKA